MKVDTNRPSESSKADSWSQQFQCQVCLIIIEFPEKWESKYSLDITNLVTNHPQADHKFLVKGLDNSLACLIVLKKVLEKHLLSNW